MHMNISTTDFLNGKIALLIRMKIIPKIRYAVRRNETRYPVKLNYFNQMSHLSFRYYNFFELKVVGINFLSSYVLFISQRRMKHFKWAWNVILINLNFRNRLPA